MFTVLYSFETIESKEKQFVESWAELTALIYEYEGSLGSRLHKKEENHFIAYAQWPSKEKWAASGKKLPEKAALVSAKMREACSKIETIYEMEVVEDLLKKEVFM